MKRSTQNAKDLGNSSSIELFDTELRCLKCSLPLCVSGDQVPVLMTSLRSTGQVVLLCACGQAQLVRNKRPRLND